MTTTATPSTAPTTSTPGGTATTEQAAEAGGWLLPLAVLIVGSFMSVLDTSIVNVAIPRIQIDLGTSADDVEWVVTGYTLALGVVVPLTGYLGMRLGQTRLYILSMIGFALGSALCGLAWGLPSLIAFRLLQAVPGGVLPVVTLTMLYRIVPPAKVGAASGIYGLGTVVAPAIGPTLGGALVEYANWRYIFFINVPIAVLGTALAVIVFPRVRPTDWPRLDLWGFLTSAYGVAAALLAFSEGDDWGWTGYRILGLFVSSALSLALFVVIELEVESPLINLRIFASRPYLVSLTLLAIAVTGLFSALFFLPQFLQQVQGLPELNSGLVLLPASLVLVVLVPVTGRLYDRFGPRYPVMIGMAFLAYGSFLLAHLTPDTPRPDIELWLVIRNVGVGIAFIPVITAGVAALPAHLTAPGSATNNLVQRVVSSVAVAVFGSLNTMLGAKLLADWAPLIHQGAGADPRVAQAVGQGPSGLYPLYRELQSIITTTAYANGFSVVGLMALAGVGLAVLLPSGGNAGTRERVTVEL